MSKIISEITIKNESNFYYAVEAEKKDLITKRAKVSISLQKNDVKIQIEAEDFTSYRALESALMRLLVTYHKMRAVENE